MRILRYLKAQTFLFALLPGLVFSLGLGDLGLESALNEKFSARIQLLLTDSETVDDPLAVRLADSEAFKRAEIERPFILSLLRFELRQEAGMRYIYIYSEEPIREPFLNFLVEMSWPRGHLFRQYTVLLDPVPHIFEPGEQLTVGTPVAIDAPATGAAVTDTADLAGGDALSVSTIAGDEAGDSASFAEGTSAAAEDRLAVEHKVIYAKDFEHYGSSSGGSSYGPTRELDTLWSIAKAVRPNNSISIQQMMLALFYANQDAFLQQNINGLKRGKILRIPGTSELDSFSYAEALAAVNSQNALWGEVRKNIIGDTVSDRPVFSPDAEVAVGQEEAEAKTSAELKLVSPSAEKEAAEAGQSKEEGGLDAGDAAVARDLVLAQESVEVLTQENADLQEQLQEVETLVEDLKRLVELKDDRFAALQAQLLEKQAALGKLETEDTITGAEEEVVTTEEERQGNPVFVEDADFSGYTEEQPAEETKEADQQESVAIDRHIDPSPQPKKGISVSFIAFILGSIALISALIFFVLRRLKGGTASKYEKSAVAVISALIFFVLRRLKGGTASKDKKSAAAVEKSLDATREETIAPAAGEGEEDLFDADASADPLEDETERNQHGSTEEEKESLQEVNTYLAFEQFDQAEECVREAIKQEPDNIEYYIKLLEVFYTSGNKKAYEETAKTLSRRVDQNSEYWDMAVSMWSELSPNRALFEEGAEEEEEEHSAAGSGGGVVDITTDTERATSNSSDLAEEKLDEQQLGLEPELEDMALDPDMGEQRDEGSAAPEIDFSLDKEAVAITEENDQEGVDAGQVADDNVLDFDLELDEEKAEDNSAQLDNMEEISPQIAIPEDDEGEDEMEQTLAMSISSASSVQAGGLENEVEAKLDLARAYIELGEKENARLVLDEINSEGDAQQKKQAKELLAQVD